MRRTGTGGVLLVAMAVAALLGPARGEAQAPAPEPLYRGRPLADWIRALRDGTPMVRERAVVILCEVEKPPVPLLVGAMADQDFNVRTMAIFCLGRLGPQARDAVPALVKALEDPDWIVRRYAAGSLGFLESTAREAAAPLARTAVQDPRDQVRVTAAFAMSRLGPEARETSRTVLTELSTTAQDEAVRTRAAELLRDLERR